MSIPSREEIKKQYLTIDKINQIESDEKEAKLLEHKLSKLKLIPDHMFRWYICGPSQSGKSHFMYYLLIKYYKLYFDHIYIFSPTFDMDKSAEMFKAVFDEKKILRETYSHYYDLDLDKINEIMLKQQQEVNDKGIYRAKKVLIIIDDLITSKLIKSPLLQTLFFRGRHYSISLMISSQSYMSLPRPLRLNLTAISLFAPNRTEIKRFSDEQESSLIDNKKLEQITKMITSKRYNFIYINRQANLEDQYRENLNNIIDLTKIK